jgi:DNA-binding LytR/AlgR family response regulator
MGLKVLIVEDEPLAAAQLAAQLAAIRPDVQVVAVCDTVRSTVEWLKNNEAPGLMFFDIHLGDGICFEVFDQIKTESPVIFTTAYDQYALKAFKVNSIDYLLKPIDRAELAAALQKFDNTEGTGRNVFSPDFIEKLMLAANPEPYKKRFLVKVGVHIRMADVADILYFYSYSKGTYLKMKDGKDYLIDQSLEVLEEQVDPKIFFRINRKYLIALKSINDVITYSNSRLKLKIALASEDDFLVAREKVKEFKTWLEG